MPKVFNNTTVYDAAMQRFDTIYQEFDNYIISFSGGKDSSVMLQLAAQKAREHGKKISVLYVDLEAQYQATIQHVAEMIGCLQDVLEEWYWIAMPLTLRNAVSVIQPKWICWDKAEKDKWVRDMPDNPYVIHEDNYPAEWDWYTRGMTFKEFRPFFTKWFNDTHGGTSAIFVGIRSDESLNRFRTIVNNAKTLYKGYKWTTRIKLKNKPTNAYAVYPLYDWTTEDDWTAVFKFNLRYNKIYELMYKNGVSIHDQRLCQPYGDDQKNGLDQFRFLEPETWEKVLNRVNGVNFGNIYCNTSVLGNYKTEKPAHMSWEQYAIFLLESLGVYAPDLRNYYYKKIKGYFDWCKKQGVSVVDNHDLAEDSGHKAQMELASWRRIARVIEKNDYRMQGLSFGQAKKDVEKIDRMKQKYTKYIYGKNTENKRL